MKGGSEDPPRKFLKFITQKDTFLRPFSPVFLCLFPPYLIPIFHFFSPWWVRADLPLPFPPLNWWSGPSPLIFRMWNLKLIVRSYIEKNNIFLIYSFFTKTADSAGVTDTTELDLLPHYSHRQNCYRHQEQHHHKQSTYLKFNSLKKGYEKHSCTFSFSPRLELLQGSIRKFL